MSFSPSRPLRVLYFLAYPQRMAGADRSLFALISNLPAEVEPTVVLTGEGRVAEAYREAGIDLRVLSPGPALSQYGKAVPEWSPLKKGWVATRDYLPFAWRLHRLLEELGTDLVHTNEGRGTLLAGPVARWAGRPLVGHRRGRIPFGGAFRWLYERLPDHFIAVSESTRDDLSPAAQARSTVVYNGTEDVSDQGTPVAWLEALRAEDVTTVGCFASMTPFKGHHHLLRAVAQLNRRGWRDRVAFVCLGDLDAGYPAYTNALLDLKRDLAVDNLTFTGWRSDPFSFYQSVDVTVLPSVASERVQINGETMEIEGNEGFPRTHLEAMCFGLPIVGTDIAGVREQVEHGENGLVVPPSDPDALADALEQLLTDPALREHMGNKGKERVMERFSTAAYVEGVVSVYRRVAR